MAGRCQPGVRGPSTRFRARSAPWPDLEDSWGTHAGLLLTQLERLRAEETEAQERTRVRVSTPPERAPVVSVVVPVYRGTDTIAAVLGGLRAQDLAERFEVIVVASGEDATADIVRRVFPEFILLPRTDGSRRVQRATLELPFHAARLLRSWPMTACPNQIGFGCV